MRYNGIVKAVFSDRPNRFIAHALLGGRTETVHVKNTGRCKELLIKGAEVYLDRAENPNRKTSYDLVAVKKSNGLLINIDSQAPNAVAREWLDNKGFSRIVPEYAYGGSRIDFYLERDEEKCLLEVKGCTLEIGGKGYFPDAPTLRGVKHLKELIRAKSEGYRAVLLFVIQMDGIYQVFPNTDTHPEFGEVLNEAKKAGVEVIFLPCHVEPDSITAGEAEI